MLLDLFNYRLDTHLAALFWNYAEYLVWTVRMGFGVYKHSNRRQILPARSTIWGFVSHLFRVKYWINEEKKIFFFKIVLTKQIIFICCAIDIVYPVFSISKRVEGLLRKPLNFLNFAVTEHAVGSTAFVLVSRLTGRFWIADISFNSRVIVFECMLFQCSWRAMTQREIMPETRTGQVAWQRISMITKGFFFYFNDNAPDHSAFSVRQFCARNRRLFSPSLHTVQTWLRAIFSFPEIEISADLTLLIE